VSNPPPKANKGSAIDSSGALAYDPSANVFAWVEVNVKRIDDLRAAQEAASIERRDNRRREMDLRAAFEREFAVLRAEHAAKTLEAEARRTDALRELDRAELRSATDRYQVAVEALSRETKAIAEALRASVEGTRKALADQYDAKNRETDARLSAVERFQAAGTGRGLGARELWALIGGMIILGIAIYKAIHG